MNEKRNQQPVVVLDASAVLALLFEEPGHDIVEDYIATSIISSVNISEVIGRFTRVGRDPKSIIDTMVLGGLEVIDFTMSHAITAAKLLPLTRVKGLSFADRACLALAQSKSLTTLTADRAWTSIEAPIDIELIR